MKKQPSQPPDQTRTGRGCFRCACSPWVSSNVGQRKMKPLPLVLTTVLAACMFQSCSTSGRKAAIITLPPFEDNYRWHSYHLTKESPKSSDGIFRLVGVSSDGDIELTYLPDGTRRVVKRSASAKEAADSRMPMRVIKTDFESQSADFEWLTTN